jgi:hypothetical protein
MTLKRTWSDRRDEAGYFYTHDGIIPQLNVRLELTSPAIFGWAAYCGGFGVGHSYETRLEAQERAEEAWEHHREREDA